MLTSPWRVNSDNLEPVLRFHPVRIAENPRGSAFLSSHRGRIDPQKSARISGLFLALAREFGEDGADGGGEPVAAVAAKPVLPAASKVTIDEVMARWKDRLTSRCRPRTVPQMLGVVRRVSEAAGWKTVDQIDIASAEAVLQARRRGDNGTKWGGTTHDSAVGTLRVFGEFLRRSKLCTVNPLADLERMGGKAGDGARPLTEAQVRGMLIEAARGKSGHGKAWMLDAVFLATMPFTGLRLSEACEMRWENIVEDADGPTLVTDPAWEGNKSGDKDEIPIRADLYDLLLWWKTRVPSKATDLVFPRAPAHRRWHIIREAAGIPESDPRTGGATPHSMRKSFITWLDALSIPRGLVSHLARHSGTLAEQVYIKHDPRMARRAVEALPPLWAGDAKVFWTNAHKALDNGARLDDITSVTPDTSPMRSTHTSLDKTDRPVRMGSGVTTEPQGPGRSVQSSVGQNQRTRCFVDSGRADQIADVLDAISRLIRTP